MIVTNILYFCFLLGGWVSGVSAAPRLDPKILNFLATTDTEFDWAPAYVEIDPDKYWLTPNPARRANVLDKFFFKNCERFESMVNVYLRDPLGLRLSLADMDANLNWIHRLIFLMRYSNLRFLHHFMSVWGEPEISPMAVINEFYVNNVAARYHLEKEVPTGRDERFMRVMVNLAVLFAQNQSSLDTFEAAPVRARVELYLDMINMVYKAMGELMKIRTLQPYSVKVDKLEKEINDLKGWGFHGFVSPEIRKVAGDLVQYILAVILMHGNPDDPSPNTSSLSDLILIPENPEVRDFLSVSDEENPATPQDYWQRLLYSFEWVLGIIWESQGGHPWIPKLQVMYNQVRDMGRQVRDMGSQV